MSIKPPNGYKSWLQYAVSTMDSRSPNIESIVAEGDADANWDRVIGRDEIISAARSELKNVLSEKAMIDLRLLLLSQESAIADSDKFLYLFKEVMGRDPNCDNTGKLDGKTPEWIKRMVEDAIKNSGRILSLEEVRTILSKCKTPLSDDIIKERNESD